MYNIIPFILMILSLGVIIAIVSSKFSVLANLDVDSIQAEREAKFKERIISNRLKRNIFRYWARLKAILSPVGGWLGGFFKSLYRKLVEYKENYQSEKESVVMEENAAEKLFAEIEELLDRGENDAAESRFIKIISLDSKNIRAFRGLGKLYFERKDFNEAKQTIEHAIRLLEKDLDPFLGRESSDFTDDERLSKDSLNRNLAGSYYDLAQVNKSMEDFDAAIVSIDRALASEANNPKFLDTKLEISIMKKDKDLAEKTLQELREANPENGKLAELEKEVSEI